MSHVNYAQSAIMVGFGRKSIQPAGTIANYDGAIPVGDVKSMLFGWDALPAPMFASIDGKPVAIESRVANYRSDTQQILGVVGADRATHQYGEALVDNVASILGGPTNLGISAAGYLRNGAVGWLTVSLPATQVTADGIEFLPQIMAYSSHDATLATEYRRTVINMICNNQMSSALNAEYGQANGMSKVRVRHTRNSALKIESAREALGILVETADAFEAATSELCATSITQRDWAAIVDELCGPMPTEAGRAQTLAQNRRDTVNHLYRSDPRCSPWHGTAYGAVQTMNTYSQHVQSVRGQHRDDRNLLATINGDWDAHDTRVVRAVRQVLTRRGA